MKLTFIDLSYNKIRKFNPDWFQKLNKLEVIKLNNNKHKFQEKYYLHPEKNVNFVTFNNHKSVNNCHTCCHINHIKKSENHDISLVINKEMILTKNE